MKKMILGVLLLIVGCKNNEKFDQSPKTIASEVVEIQLDVYDFNGVEQFLRAKDDKVHVVNFWATWCRPCVKELPYFEQINSKFSDVEVLLVSLDFPSKYESNLKPFIIEKKLRSKVIALNDVDANTWIPKVDENWTGAIPATIIFNKKERKFYERSFDYEELEKEIKQFLN